MPVTAYTTVAAMIAQYGIKLYQVLNVANGSTITANAQLLDAINKGNARVDGSVVGRYAPDTVSDNPILTDAAAKISWWQLISATRPDLAGTDQISRLDYEDAVSTLTKVAKGATNGGIDLAFPPTDRTENLELIQTVIVGENVIQDDPLSWERRLSVMRARF